MKWKAHFHLASEENSHILYPIQYGREYCIVLMKWKARFNLPPKGNSSGMIWSGNAKLIRKWLPTWMDHVFEGQKMQMKVATAQKSISPKFGLNAVYYVSKCPV